MAALTDNRRDNWRGELGRIRTVPVAAGAHLFFGGMMSFDASGYGVPAADVAGQASKAIGLVIAEVDNTTGANGAAYAHVAFEGDFEFPVGTLVQADVGKTVHAVDDGTLATTSTNDRQVGVLWSIMSGRAHVRIK